MTEDQYIPLIHQSLTDQLSAEDEDHLQKWLAADSNNQHIYAEILEGWEIANSYDSSPLAHNFRNCCNRITVDRRYLGMANHQYQRPSPRKNHRY